jgi:hypothetical protein
MKKLTKKEKEKRYKAIRNIELYSVLAIVLAGLLFWVIPVEGTNATNLSSTCNSFGFHIEQGSPCDRAKTQIVYGAIIGIIGIIGVLSSEMKMNNLKFM